MLSILNHLLDIWWIFIPLACLIFFAIWEATGKKNKEVEQVQDRLKKLEDELEQLKKEKKES